MRPWIIAALHAFIVAAPATAQFARTMGDDFEKYRRLTQELSIKSN